MKNYFLILFSLISFVVTAQITPADTAQILVPDRVNQPYQIQKPYVIFISADGFRYDYIEKYNAKNLKKLSKKGVWAKEGMYPSYPSSTFPNHYSLVTGMFPAHHGIVDNVFYDPARDEKYIIGTATNLDGSWYGGMPLWGLAETQGMMAASLFWVGSESEAGARPSYYYPYHEKFNDDQKINIILKWLTLPENKRPHFITLYFPEVDHAGHRFGPDAVETEKAVKFIDDAIGKLTKNLAALNLPINFVFVSDHGMIEVEPENYIPMPEIDDEKYITINGSTIFRIYARDTCDILPLYRELILDNSKDYEVYLAENMPEQLYHSVREDSLRRIGDIILIPKGVKIFVDPKRGASRGKHGFDSYEIPEMKATFMAWGPAFKSKLKINSFENIHIYPLVAKILGLEIPEDIDGEYQVLKEVLKNP